MEHDTEPLNVDLPTWIRNLLVADPNRCQVQHHLSHDQDERDYTEEIFTIDMLDDCLLEEIHITQEYDSIYIIMGTNDIRNKDGMRAAMNLVGIV